jgi:flagellar hook protein FlgE
MDVIANNISNVNTVGYKYSRATFNEVFSQTLSGASGANPEAMRGGINPMQIGLGAGVAAIDKVMTQGAAQRTDWPFDLMIEGEGFFIVGNASGTYFTRAGNFHLDNEGYLAMPSGHMVMGWDAYQDSATAEWMIQKGVVEPILIAGEKEFVPPKSTKLEEVTGNLNALTDPEKIGTMNFFDSVGNQYTVDVKYTYTDIDGGTPPTMGWIVEVGMIAYPKTDSGARTEGYLLTPGDGTPDGGGTQQAVPEIHVSSTLTDVELLVNDPLYIGYMEIGRLWFDTNGNLISTVAPATAGTPPVPQPLPATPTDYEETLSLMIGVSDPSYLTPGATFGDAVNRVVNLDFSLLTQFGNLTANAKITMKDGNKPGTLNDINVGPDGKITGTYTNGDTRLLGQIPIVEFVNPAGLSKEGNNLFATTPNSGDFDGVGIEIDSIGARIMAGVLEMSNVDLASEFTEMITTQRGFQANSRSITTSDDMLQELVNLKR